MLIKRASLLLREMLHIEHGSRLIGILNRECAVLPSLIKSAAIPKDATANAISPFDLILASKVL